MWWIKREISHAVTVAMIAHKAVIVTYSRYRIAVTVMTSLAKAGVDVFAGDHIDWPLGRFSRYNKSHFKYRNPFIDPDGFIDDLIHKAKQCGATLLVPTFTETAIVARYQNKLRTAGLNTVLSEYDLMEILNDKGKVSALADELGIAIPQTWYPKNLQSLDDIKDGLPYPVIIKPRGGKAGEGQAIVNTSGQLTAAFEKLLIKNPEYLDKVPIIQRFITGYDIGVALFYDHGVVRSQVGFEVRRKYQRVHSIDRVSALNQTALNAGNKLLSHLAWHGVAQMDFIVDKKTDVAYLLEVNPRFWGSIQNAIEAGVDFPQKLIALNKIETAKQLGEQNTEIRSIWFYPFVLSALTSLLQGRFREFLNHGFNPFDKNLRFDDLSLMDPLPGFVEPFLGLFNLLISGSLALDAGHHSGDKSGVANDK